MIYYAIGDIHGCKDLYLQLQKKIFDDLALRPKNVISTIIHLGDYIDRGPDSKGVIDEIMKLDDEYLIHGVKIRALKGNHEDMFLKAFMNRTMSDVQNFLYNGGQQTLESYGINPRSKIEIPPDHKEWLLNLPVIHIDEYDKIIFVHAGLNPLDYPSGHTDEELMWSRYRLFFDSQNWPDNPELNDYLVVHGHTPLNSLNPYADSRRVNCDSGAVYGGSLTAAVIVDGKFEKFISVKAQDDWTEVNDVYTKSAPI